MYVLRDVLGSVHLVSPHFAYQFFPMSSATSIPAVLDLDRIGCCQRTRLRALRLFGFHLLGRLLRTR